VIAPDPFVGARLVARAWVDRRSSQAPADASPAARTGRRPRPVAACRSERAGAITVVSPSARAIQADPGHPATGTRAAPTALGRARARGVLASRDELPEGVAVHVDDNADLTTRLPDRPRDQGSQDELAAWSPATA